MRNALLVVVLCAVGAWAFWYTTENAKQERRERAQRQRDERIRQESREAAQRAEDERIRKERMSAVAKEDAVRLFVRYVEKEEDR